MSATFGLDFGTTNSVVACIAPDHVTQNLKPIVLLDTDNNNRPIPSVVSYHGVNPVVGHKAKVQLKELGLGVYGEVVRSPKMFLGSPTGISVGGVARSAVDVVADLLRYICEDARKRRKGNSFETAVITIPVTMRGQARADLRQAAQKAGITIHQFVHEPLAALYGYLRSMVDFQKKLAELERSIVLVFDWGGGTLDLTLCRFQGGVLTQLCNGGDAEVGGDVFDRRLRQRVIDKHELRYPKLDWRRKQPGADQRLIQACEDTKIRLSTNDRAELVVMDVLAVSGPEKDVHIEFTREELAELSCDLVSNGFGCIDHVLDKAGVHKNDIKFCLATGGMVAMPGIQNGLREIFGSSRLRLVKNSSTVIAEGAAWIAHDKINLQMAKPIELLAADDGYINLIPAGTLLPTHGQASEPRKIDIFCVDPSDGYAKLLFARPKWPGRDSHGDARVPYAHVTLPVDPYSEPLLERLQITLNIDHDLIVHIGAYSLMRRDSPQIMIHDLEFGIDVSNVEDSDSD